MIHEFTPNCRKSIVFVTFSVISWIDPALPSKQNNLA